MRRAAHAAAQAACIADVAADRPIPFGRSIDVHPATCWCYDHVTQFAKGLAQCAPTPTSGTAPKAPDARS